MTGLRRICHRKNPQQVSLQHKTLQGLIRTAYISAFSIRFYTKKTAQYYYVLHSLHALRYHSKEQQCGLSAALISRQRALQRHSLALEPTC